MKRTTEIAAGFVLMLVASGTAVQFFLTHQRYENAASIPYLVALGVALQRRGETSRAIEVLRGAVSRAPDNLWAQRNLGACVLSAGQIQEAPKVGITID